MISGFKKEFAFLSNFAVINVELRGNIWQSTEHIFQACKTVHKNEIEMIRLAGTPGKAKRLGRKITLRSDWDKLKVDFMRKCLVIKFKYMRHFKEELLMTNKQELVESNYWHDNFWGNCYCNKCKQIDGQNRLGKLLMELRQELFASYIP